jgi:hypothetical protein
LGANRASKPAKTRRQKSYSQDQRQPILATRWKHATKLPTLRDQRGSTIGAKARNDDFIDSKTRLYTFALFEPVFSN